MTTTEFLPVEPPRAAPPLIDYGTLDVDIANQMRDRATRIQRLQRASVLDVGRELIAAKGLVEHGFFRSWVETACQIHIRTAERLMQAALLAQKNDNLSYLPPDGLLALASRSAPTGVVNEIIGRIAVGERPSAARIKHQIAQAKQAEKRASQSPQQAELQDIEGCEHSLIEVAAHELIAMLLAWNQFDEFMALLRNADLSIVTRAPRNHYDKLAAIAGSDRELVLVGSSETSPEPEDTEKLATLAEALAVPDVITGNTATRNCAGTTERVEPDTLFPRVMDDVSAEQLMSVWGPQKKTLGGMDVSGWQMVVRAPSNPRKTPPLPRACCRFAPLQARPATQNGNASSPLQRRRLLKPNGGSPCKADSSSRLNPARLLRLRSIAERPPKQKSAARLVPRRRSKATSTMLSTKIRIPLTRSRRKGHAIRWLVAHYSISANVAAIIANELGMEAA